MFPPCFALYRVCSCLGGASLLQGSLPPRRLSEACGQQLAAIARGQAPWGTVRGAARSRHAARWLHSHSLKWPQQWAPARFCSTVAPCLLLLQVPEANGLRAHFVNAVNCGRIRSLQVGGWSCWIFIFIMVYPLEIVRCQSTSSEIQVGCAFAPELQKSQVPIPILKCNFLYLCPLNAELPGVRLAAARPRRHPPGRRIQHAAPTHRWVRQWANVRAGGP